MKKSDNQSKIAAELEEIMDLESGVSRSRADDGRAFEERDVHEEDSAAYLHQGMLYVDPKLLREDEAYAFVPVSVRGEPNSEREHAAIREGYKPKDISGMPTLMRFTQGLRGTRNREKEFNYYDVGGQLFCFRPKEMDKKIRGQYQTSKTSAKAIDNWTSQSGTHSINFDRQRTGVTRG